MAFPTDIDFSIGKWSIGTIALLSGGSAKDHKLAHDAISNALVALETKVGVNNSSDPHSLDYKVSQPAPTPPPVPVGGVYALVDDVSPAVAPEVSLVYEGTPSTAVLDAARSASPPEVSLLVYTYLDLYDAVSHAVLPKISCIASP